jgi:hypothetical protein
LTRVLVTAVPTRIAGESLVAGPGRAVPPASAAATGSVAGQLWRSIAGRPDSHIAHERSIGCNCAAA